MGGRDRRQARGEEKNRREKAGRFGDDAINRCSASALLSLSLSLSLSRDMNDITPSSALVNHHGFFLGQCATDVNVSKSKSSLRDSYSLGEICGFEF